MTGVSSIYEESFKFNDEAEIVELEASDVCLYVCQYCSEVFTHPDSLAEHEATKHQVDPEAFFLQEDQTYQEGNESELYAQVEEVVPLVHENELPEQSAVRRSRRAPKICDRAKKFWHDEALQELEDAASQRAAVLLQQPAFLGSLERRRQFPRHEHAGTSVRLAGDSCIYCSTRIEKPWQLVDHMVVAHNVELVDLDCGEHFPMDMTGECAMCGTNFEFPHDLFVHCLVDHGNLLFSKEYFTRTIVSMQNDEGNNLSLTIRSKPKLRSRGSVSSKRRVFRPVGKSVDFGYMTPEQIAMAATRVRMHTMGYQCSFCWQIKPCREACLEHTYNCHMVQRKFQCPHCPKSYGNNSNLKTHVLAVHSQERMFPCPNCPMKYRSNSDLRVHLARNVCDQAVKGGFACQKCGMLWYNRAALATHQRQCEGLQRKEDTDALAGIAEDML